MIRCLFMYLFTPYMDKVPEGMGYSLFISLSIVPRILLGMEEVNRHFVLKKR